MVGEEGDNRTVDTPGVTEEFTVLIVVVASMKYMQVSKCIPHTPLTHGLPYFNNVTVEKNSFNLHGNKVRM